MQFKVKNGKVAVAVADMVNEFYEVRKNAKRALLDRNVEDFKIYSAQMKSFLQMEIVDDQGNIGRVIAHLPHSVVVNPYGLRPIEDMEVSNWIALIQQQRKEMH